MKISLLDYLVCPDCRLSLECLAPVYESGEIHSGTLRCPQCGEEYPIRDFIPRMLSGSLDKEKRQTADAFGWQWNRFSEIHGFHEYEEQFLDWVLPLNRDSFGGKVVLDAGCGMGRFTRVAASFGAKEVLAVDLGRAVQAAHRNTRHLANVHVIQGDIYRLPFRRRNGLARDGDIDLIYSIGVLHHLPDPQKGFQSLISHLKSDGAISVWVYGYENNEWVVKWVNPLRKALTSRVPPLFLYWISYLMALPLHLALKLIYRPAAGHRWRLKLPAGSYLQWLSKYNLKHTHHVLFDHLVAPVAFYLKRDELERWLAESGLRDARISWRNENSWRGYARVN